MKYNIGDLIVWLFPIGHQEVSTITAIWRDFDGTIYYQTQTYRKEEDKILKENFSELELDNVCDNDKTPTPMGEHYPVKQ
jgi:hypothetical protein